jgi:hypothetical protein
MKVCAAIHHGPSSMGIDRHFAPFSCRQMMALIVLRRCRGGTLACGRHVSTSGSSAAHRSSFNIIPPPQNGENARHKLGFSR